MMITEAKKAEKVALAKAHVEAERLISGSFIEGRKGCSVGCDAIDIAAAKGENAKNEGIHAYVADYFGTPEWLEHLRDAVFEGLPKKERADWHVNIAEALPVGVDFEPIRHRIHRDILLEVAAKSIGDGGEEWREQCRSAVNSVAALHEKSLSGKIVDEEWSAARAAAEEEAAAWSAAAASKKARSAARSAATASKKARSAAAAYQKIAEIVLKHLREAGQ
jgi:hypothetical protein